MEHPPRLSKEAQRQQRRAYDPRCFAHSWRFGSTKNRDPQTLHAAGPFFTGEGGLCWDPSPVRILGSHRPPRRPKPQQPKTLP